MGEKTEMPMISPRLIGREWAARYCGVSVATFSAWIRHGIVPGPIPRTSRWDIKAIDQALDILSYLKEKPKESDLDRWKAARHARKLERDP